MAATLFYLADLPPVGATAVLDGDEGHHAATVRRTKVGEKLVLSDGRGEVADCVVTGVEHDRLELEVCQRETVAQAYPRVVLVQALPKSERSELAVELATEAGIDAIVPWQAGRCVAKWTGPKAEKGVQKWRSAARSAARQSRRPHIPEVSELHDTARLCKLIAERASNGALVLVLHESSFTPFASTLVGAAHEILLVVGPEGGIGDAELAKLTAAGAVTALLSPTVLRTSTTATVALGALGVLTNRWSSRPRD